MAAPTPIPALAPVDRPPDGDEGSDAPVLAGGAVPDPDDEDVVVAAVARELLPDGLPEEAEPRPGVPEKADPDPVTNDLVVGAPGINDGAVIV